MQPDTTPSLVRIIVRGWTYWHGEMHNLQEARAMLLAAFSSSDWPTAQSTFAITPGGFVRAVLPRNYQGARGWLSDHLSLANLIPHAEAAVEAVIAGDVLKRARERTRYLTLGVDLNIDAHKEERIGHNHRCRPACPPTCTHAELVAVIDTRSGAVVRWTGKSYPVDAQQHTLVHVADLRSHLLKLGAERLLVLGCHDLQMFIDRGRKSLYADSPKQIRRQRMRKLARQFRPTVILHHPHSTYSPRIWSAAWGATRGALPGARVWASGIAFCGNPTPRPSRKPWQTLDATRAATANSAYVLDVVTKGWGC